ncbi:hypothetical protein CKK33_06460 [Mucilaginibacter sp. MD40]|uniref:hypothetical protein n=1 Tax=Mucilaginibacter sp. MD40 TaxID=2029590 RepID=UPI000BACD6AC|nr:hypothetical protein [Mucilaginibacter sp. MD40]PAW93154.1 hypothetical protein CKK33_06460 [Mucilaginibacter sp. MD40]
MEFNSANGTAEKNERTAIAVKTEPAKNGQASTKVKAGEGKNNNPATAEAKPEKQEEKPIVTPEPVVLTLDAKLKMVDDLHRKSVQRLNLLSRLNQLESFEVTLLQESDELEDNPYQGCKLIIRDDKHREFMTTTPGLIRLVSQFIYTSCQAKLKEIEESINFPAL